ncbi:MAG TPA: septal ring lytic transglycosylase RlpA family protein [Granulicella sp.]
MFFTNEMRLASCSIVALVLMSMSVPGLVYAPTNELPASALEPPATLAPPPAPVTPKARKSLFGSLIRNHPLPTMSGIASWYGAVLHGHKTASGETFDMNQMTACHRTLPFGTMVKVTDTHTGKSVIVRINDRGVLFADRVIDLSRAAAERLGIRSKGVASVRLKVLTKQQAASEMSSMDAASSSTADSGSGE